MQTAAPYFEAMSAPSLTAFSAFGDPSVAIRTFLNMAGTPSSGITEARCSPIRMQRALMHRKSWRRRASLDRGRVTGRGSGQVVVEDAGDEPHERPVGLRNEPVGACPSRAGNRARRSRAARRREWSCRQRRTARRDRSRKSRNRTSGVRSARRGRGLRRRARDHARQAVHPFRSWQDRCRSPGAAWA